jgi:hypothetical protein
MTNDLFPGKRYGGPIDEFQAFDALPRAVRRALDAALFQWSAADCLERLARGETVSGLIDLIRQADRREAQRRVPRLRTGRRGRTLMLNEVL